MRTLGEATMFDTPVLNVAIGLVFCFAAMGLAASTVTEALASLVKLRANTLVSGVQQMLNDPKFEGLALQVYKHALVHPQGDGDIRSRSRFWTYGGPSYIKAENFATALVDILQQTPGDVAQIKASVDAISDPQIKQLLQGMLARAAGDMDHLRGQIAAWFDTAMDRVSGTYKRQAQLISFLIGLVLAATMNVDATRVVTTLWANPALAREVASEVSPLTSETSTVKEAVTQLQVLPVGIALLGACDGRETLCVGGHAVHRVTLLGWLITAIAAVFGAPFWFDLLGKLVQLRGAGPKPIAPKADT
jgi:hypothetical protein